MRRIIALVVGLVFIQGCVPAMIVGGVYHSSKTKQQRQQFNEQFQKTNMEREKAGLAPLDWCTEAVRFEPKMAKQDPRCKDKIEFDNSKQ